MHLEMRSTQTNNNSGRIDNHGGNNLYGASFNGPVSFGAASHVQDPSACLRALKCTDPRIYRQEIESRKDDLLRDTCAWVTEDNAFRHGGNLTRHASSGFMAILERARR